MRNREGGNTNGAVVPIEAPPAVRALGFLVSKGTIQSDVKAAFADDIAAMFDEQR